MHSRNLARAAAPRSEITPNTVHIHPPTRLKRPAEEEPEEEGFRAISSYPSSGRWGWREKLRLRGCDGPTARDLTSPSAPPNLQRVSAEEGERETL